MLLIATNSFFPYLLMNIILASQIGFYKFLGTNSNERSAQFSPYNMIIQENIVLPVGILRSLDNSKTTIKLKESQDLAQIFLS